MELVNHNAADTLNFQINEIKRNLENYKGKVETAELQVEKYQKTVAQLQESLTDHEQALRAIGGQTKANQVEQEQSQ